ncbi:SH3 domain-containing protein [Psychrobacter sp. PAMC 21119]|uniref:SH3 domain-containing protein n=1 Tax=Psychrobacter sp. PAMC 21119 TaxID=1112209 RepID=UPI0002884242|nr:SH3 domain-containing protein [Psychrobacter sp. PAMC 21119]
MSLLKPLLSVSSKSMVLLAVSTSLFALSVNANAGLLDSIYEVQNTISSIGRTADTIRGSKQAVSDLGEEVGFTETVAQNTQSNTGKLVSGSILSGKLQSTKLHSQANKASNPIAILSQQDIMIYMGTEQNGYYHVQSDKGEGWVSKPLVSIQ